MSKKRTSQNSNPSMSQSSSTSSHSHSQASSIKPDTINEFRDLIKNISLYQKFNLRTDDQFLTRFLKTAKNDTKKALKRYEAYYNLLINLPRSENFTSGSINDRKWLHEAKDYLDVEIRNRYNYPSFGYYGQDKKGRAIIGFEASTCDPFLETENYLDTCLYLTIVTFDYILEYHDFCQDTGFVMIDDWHGLNFKMFKFFMSDTSFIKNFSALISGTMPIRISQYYIVNGPKLMNMMYNAFKIFLSEKIKSRMWFASDLEVVKNDIGEEALPVFLKGGARTHVDIDGIDLEEQLMKIFPRIR